MKITIKASPKEIAALVENLQKRQTQSNQNEHENNKILKGFYQEAVAVPTNQKGGKT